MREHHVFINYFVFSLLFIIITRWNECISRRRHTMITFVLLLFIPLSLSFLHALMMPLSAFGIGRKIGNVLRWASLLISKFRLLQ